MSRVAEEIAEFSAWAHFPEVSGVARSDEVAPYGAYGERKSVSLDEEFLGAMEAAIDAAQGDHGEWIDWIERDSPARVQAVLGERLQRHFSALLRTPMLCSEGGLHVVEPGYMQLVHIANYCMMLAAAVRLEVARVADRASGHGCAVSDMMGGAA